MQVELLGHRLLQQGFRSFFLYLFNAIEGREFIIEPLHEKLFDYFEDIIDGKVTRANINICPRSAKCLGKGTLVRMFDGTLKKVEDIKINDLIMGDDSTPRKVLNIGRGREEMFKITNQDGTSFTCNGSHILVLYNTLLKQTENQGHKKHYKMKEINTISVFDYLKKSGSYKKRNKMIKTGLEYPFQKIDIDSYVLGYWLGDGYSDGARVIGHKEDLKIFKKYLEKINYKYCLPRYDKRNTNVEMFTIQGGKKGEFKSLLKKYNLINNKHIPKAYLINSTEERLKLLAGLIDTDGNNSKRKNDIEFTNKNKKLIDDVVELARSLGFYVKERTFTVKNTRYYRLSIVGDFAKIPCLYKRKTEKNRKTRKISPLLQYFKIESLGIGDYYGFELDGNHKFVLGDFTVSHNTTFDEYFVVYTFTICPQAQIIYTSYSQSLLSEIASKVASIMESPIYKALFPYKTIEVEEKEATAIDDFWRDYLFKENKGNTYSNKLIKTYAGGVCLFSAVGSQITGFGCFDYNTLILTEDGFKKIGDVVENKYNGKIWSYNFEKKQKELQPIYDYVKNEKSDYLKLVLDNGEIINCTPDHIFYLKNGQEIRADELRTGFKIMSNSLNLGNRYVQSFSNFISRIIFVKSKINLFLRKVIKVVIKFCSLFLSLITNVLGYYSPNATAFNITNRAIRQIIIFGYLFIWAFIFCNSNGNFLIDFVKFTIGVVLIFHIFFTSTITKIFKSVIGRVRVKMSNLFGRFTNKGKQNKPMYQQRPISIIFTKINSFIAFIIGVLFHKLVSLCGKNFTSFRNIISLVLGYREIVNIVDCNHKAPSYCVTLWNNNNFYITKSQVLVHNCGVRNSKKFSGFLTIDDGNKPADIHSQVLREKAVRYFEETLLSRLNNPNTPIINIQQRLHLEDLSGILIKKYGFDTLKVPLLDENGVCNLPSQYTENRIKELQINNYMFSSQYQQEPIILGGAVIKREWFNYYDVNKSYKYSKIVIAGDTAMSVKEHADKSCFLVGGITENNNLHILDCAWGKWEYPELKQQIINLWNKWQLDKRTTSASALFIEEKSSGIQVLQELKKKGIPILSLQAEKDKLTRVESVLDYIASGMVYLPDSEIYGFNGKLLAEWESFTRDNSHLHDDATDTLCYLINKTIAKKQVSLLDVL